MIQNPLGSQTITTPHYQTALALRSRLLHPSELSYACRRWGSLCLCTERLDVTSPGIVGIVSIAERSELADRRHWPPEQSIIERRKQCATQPLTCFW